MPRDVGERAVRLALSRAPDRLHLVFFGGEPLLRWDDLVGLTDDAMSMGAAQGARVRPTLTTNGTLLTEARCQWLAQRHFVVAVSCDGIAAAHDANRVDAAGVGSHGKTWRGLQVALAANLNVRVVLVIHPSNVQHLPESVDALVAAGFFDLVLNPDWSATWEDPRSLDTWTRAYERIAQSYVKAYRNDRPFWISTIDPRIAEHIQDNEQQDRCDLGRRNLVVAPSGNLYPCDRLVGTDDGTLAIGHLDTGIDPTLLEAFTTQAFSVPSSCLTCAVRKRCRNRCACANLAMSGHAGTPTSLLCFHEQLCLRTADDAAEVLFSEGNERFLRRHYGSEVSLGRLGLAST